MKSKSVVVISLLLAALLLPGIAHADVIMPGYHSVTHHLYVDNVADYDDYAFFIYPTHMSGGAALLDGTQVPGFYKFASPYLYAVPASELPADIGDVDFVPPAGALVSATAFDIITELPDSNQTTEIETHYDVSIQNGSLVLTENPGAGTRITAGPEPLVAFIVTACALGLVMVYMAGKRR